MASWTGLLHMQRAALRRKREGRELDRLDWPRDAVPSHTSGCPSGIRLAAVPAARGTDRRDAPWTCPASSGLHTAPRGASACFPDGWAVTSGGPGACHSPHWHLRFRKCLWPRFCGDSWAQIREQEGAGPCGPGALGEVLGREVGVPAGEVSAPRGELPACTP